MNLEFLISSMMKVNIKARLWHWMTDTAQHHTTFEQFLTQNETLMDSLVESSLGNDVSIEFKNIKIEIENEKYSLDSAIKEIKQYRANVSEIKSTLSNKDTPEADELLTILDDVTELSSKTLYLLKLK